MMFPTNSLLCGIALYASAVSAATTWNVSVSDSNATLAFEPNNITAVPGDTVQFIWNPKNHSVTQSSFAQPCTPLEGGIDYGFIPVANGTAASNLPTRKLVVNDTKPVWFYCRQAANTAASHCFHGMVFAINGGAEGSNNSVSKFQANALAAGAQFAANGTNTTNTTDTTTTTTTTPTTATTSSDGSKSTGNGGSGSGKNGATSMNIDGTNAMLMAGFGMVVSLMV